MALCSILRNPESRLQTLNIACNELTVEHLELLHLSLVNNKVLSGIDMRGNQGYDKGKERFELLYFFKFQILFDINRFIP